MSRNSAIKVLNHAMTGQEGSDNSQKFVDILGLRTIFPLFMKTPTKGRAGPSPAELEGTCLKCDKEIPLIKLRFKIRLGLWSIFLLKSK